jgi:hypothetical protein
MADDQEQKHEPTVIEEPGMIDLVKCSCGWESKPYFDGREYAWAAFQKHIADARALKEGQEDG